MATHEEIWGMFLNPMVANCTPPRVGDKTSLLQTYQNTLKHYAPEQLKSAWSKLRLSHAGRRYPSLEEIVQAIGVRAVDSESQSQKDSKEATKRADRAMQTSIGQQSIQDGVAMDFYCHVQNGGRPEYTIGQRDRWLASKREAERMVNEAPDDEHGKRVRALWRMRQRSEERLIRDHGYDIVAAAKDARLA